MTEKAPKDIPWYTYSGIEDDVIISSRVRMARNLANFPFPSYFRGDDKNRVQTLIFDAFSQISNDFHAASTSILDDTSRQILEERGILKSYGELKDTPYFPESGFVMSSDGKKVCSLNGSDHIKFSSFFSGLNFRNPFELCRKIDDDLQNYLQFAASYDFGFLTSALNNAGSGMKLSARVHIPTTIRLGKFSVLLKYLKNNRCCIIPAFPQIYQNNAVSPFYLVYTSSSMNGNEIDQIAQLEAVCKVICANERQSSYDFAEQKTTVVKNAIFRAYSIVKTSILISLKEAFDIISDIKFGLRANIISGIKDCELNSLLFRVLPGHICYLMNNSQFAFEEDIESDTNLKIDRLRAIILHEAFYNLSLGIL